MKLEGRSESGLCFRTQASLQEHGSVGRQRRELYELTKHEATRSQYLPKLYREAYLVLAKLIAFFDLGLFKTDQASITLCSVMDEASPAVAVAFRRSSRNGDVVVLQRRLWVGSSYQLA